MNEPNLVLADVITHASAFLLPGAERKTSCSLLLLERNDPDALERLRKWAAANNGRVVVHDAVKKATKEKAARAAVVDVIMTGKPLDMAGAVRKAKP